MPVPQPDWLSLPVEIWLFLCARLRARDLAELCRTCSQLLLISRPILYRTLNLAAEKNRKPNEVVKYTFSLLARDRELAQSVRELTLNSSSSSKAYRNHWLVDLASMQNMTQVKRLTITDDISHAGVRTWTVGQLVQMLHDWNLDELRFPAPGAREFFLLCNNAQLIQLANAKRIILYLMFGHGLIIIMVNRLLPRLECMLTAASPSLTSLSLKAPPLHLVTLFKLRFPHLRSLAVMAHSPGLTSPDGFNAFISGHHQTLEELHLVYGTIEEQRLRGPQASAADAIVFNEGSVKLTDPDFLPNLRVLRAHQQTVEEMARARMRCLSKLNKLFIASELVISGTDERLRDIRRTLLCICSALVVYSRNWSRRLQNADRQNYHARRVKFPDEIAYSCLGFQSPGLDIRDEYPK
ncbi:hypothetical protein GGX14DRAFT_388069 [Mycena pura]|uniref:F-box domain-containing protein n=1 Tax=Mycena pura TaxID=153505 RepID=A0AAD6VU52_9AGAR|nr:hypothetical protein GGX14DRAFT_388069 [Mycena pura]